MITVAFHRFVRSWVRPVSLVFAACVSAASGTSLAPAPSQDRTKSIEPPANVAAKSKRLELFATGYFPALHGYFFVDQSNRLHVYRVLPAVLNPKSQQFETRPEDDELKPKWKGEPFYHEIYVLEEGEWLPKIWGVGDPRGAREFSKAPEHYLSFEPCDRNDALDLQRKDLKGALGAGTKIKDVVEFQKYAAVIYSIDPKTLSGTSQPFKPGDRPVWLALLKKNRTRWEYSGVTKSVSLGDYCGKATLFSLRAGISRPVLLLFFREGALNVAYSYVADDD